MEIHRKGLLILGKVYPWVYPLASFLSKENHLDFGFLIVQHVNMRGTADKEDWKELFFYERNICELKSL